MIPLTRAWGISSRPLECAGVLEAHTTVPGPDTHGKEINSGEAHGVDESGLLLEILLDLSPSPVKMK